MGRCYEGHEAMSHELCHWSTKHDQSLQLQPQAAVSGVRRNKIALDVAAEQAESMQLRSLLRKLNGCLVSCQCQCQSLAERTTKNICAVLPK